MKRTITLIKKHDEVCFGIGIVLAILLVAGFVYGYAHHVQTKAKNEAIARAKKMDGKTYTINDVAWNWIGDTKLFLKDKNGSDAGWVMMYMANPFDKKVNPLSLAFSNPHDKLPFPMKVRPHFRPTPWTSDYDGKTKEGITASYLEFEILESPRQGD